MFRNMLGGFVPESTIHGMVRDAVPGAVQEILTEAMKQVPSAHRTDAMRLFVAQEIVSGLQREVARMEKKGRRR